LAYDPEAIKLRELFGRYVPKRERECKVLDVGCGYGRNLRWLQESGYDAIGVEVNRDIIAANSTENLKTISAETFLASDSVYDAILMSHIIEHFDPQTLASFLDSHLDRLKIGGILVIATPLMTSYFYDDFDHVRPYQPIGILMVFGEGNAQVQYYSRNKLKLRDLWFRRGHHRAHFQRARYVRSLRTTLLGIVDMLSLIVFAASRGRVGRKNGWIGVFEKVA
jgi:SAM-dependent methyltransferase